MKADTNGLVNNITAQDTADMWVHEKFYMLFGNSLFGFYLLVKRMEINTLSVRRDNIQNDEPIIPAFMQERMAVERYALQRSKYVSIQSVR